MKKILIALILHLIIISVKHIFFVDHVDESLNTEMEFKPSLISKHRVANPKQVHAISAPVLPLKTLKIIAGPQPILHRNTSPKK